MKKYKGLPIYLFFTGLLALSFIFGYKIIGGKLNSTPRNMSMVKNEELESSDYPDLEILMEYDKTSPNTLIEERIYYSSCDHIITKVSSIDDELINMSKNEFRVYVEENNPTKKLISYSTNKVTLGVVKNHLCEKHYIVGQQDGKIAIFKIGENGERILDKVFLEYPISLLMDIDQEKLIDGIVVDNEEELSEILENFIS